MSWGNKLTRAAARFGDQDAKQLDAAAKALVSDARAALTFRRYQRDSNVAALSVERTRDRLDRAGWLFVVLGLMFTVVNVAQFVLGPLPEGKEQFEWYEVGVALVVEPMMMGLLLTLMRGEQIAARHEEPVGNWVRTTKWVALGFTYVMNTAQYWVLVWLAGEALVQQRETLTRVVANVADSTADPIVIDAVPVQEPEDAPEPPEAPLPLREREQAPEDVPGDLDEDDDVVVPLDKQQRQEGRHARVGRPKSPARIALEAKYAELRTQGLPHVAISPAGLDRAADVPVGTAKKVLTAIKQEYEQRQSEEVNTGGEDRITVTS